MNEPEEIPMDVFDSEEFREWAEDALQNMVPKMAGAAATISLLPPDGQTDPKFAVELGYSIMLNKPIIVIAEPGQFIPPGLLKVADCVLNIGREQLSDPDQETQDLFHTAIDQAIRNHE